MSALDDYISTNSPQTPTPTVTPTTGVTSALDKHIATPTIPNTNTSALDKYISSGNSSVPKTGYPLPTPEPKQSSVDKYMSFSNRIGQLGSEMDVGVIKGLGGIVGGAATIGNWLMTPLNNAMDKITNTKHQDLNAGDSIKTFGEHLDTGVKPEDKKYLDNVFEGLGTTVPYVLGGYAGTALKIPALVSSLGLGGVQALDTARTDYHQMVSDGDKNAGKKAAAVFGVDLALNTVAHFLGPLSQGGKYGILPSVTRILKSTVLETANYGFGQTVVSNIANGRAPMQGVWDAILTMAPISLGFGTAGEVANSANIKAQQEQIKGVIREIINNGGTAKDATSIISKLSGVDEGTVQGHIENFIANDPELQTKHDENVAKENAPDTKITEARANPGKVMDEAIQRHVPEAAKATEKTSPATEPKSTTNSSTQENNTEGNKITKGASDINKLLVLQGEKPIPENEQAKFNSSAGERRNQEQFAKDFVSNMTKTDTGIEKIKEMIRANEPVPKGVEPQMLYKAMEEWAHKNDPSFHRELANSPLNTESSQNASSLESRKYGGEKNSSASEVTKTIKEVTDKKRETAEKVAKKQGTTVEKKLAKLKEKGDNAIKKTEEGQKATRRPRLKAFIDSLPDC